MAEFKMRRSKCCNEIESVRWDIGDFCSKCNRLIPPKEYYESNNILLTQRIVSESMRGMIPGKPSDGLSRCCKAEIVERDYDLAQCVKCQKFYMLNEPEIEVKPEVLKEKNYVQGDIL